MNGPLYGIIDPSYLGGDQEVIATADAILRGGASIIQLRDKRSTTRQLLEVGRRLAAICAEAGAPFIVNDRLDVALACEADGVHLGPTDLPVAKARQIAGDEFLIGASAGTPQVAVKKVQAGADYLGTGAIFDARSSKPDASSPRGVEGLRRVVEAVDIPVFGIGGIDATTAAQVMAGGACGVAVIRALLSVDDPEQAARELVDIMSSTSQAAARGGEEM